MVMKSKLEDIVRVFFAIIIASMILAVPVCAGQKTGQSDSKIRIGILLLEPFGNAEKDLEGANDELVSEIKDIGFYTVVDYSSLKKAMEQIGKDIPGHCTDPRCVIELGSATGMNRMLYGSIDKYDNHYALQLTLIDVITKQKVESVSLEGATGVSRADLIKLVVARLHGNTIDAPTAAVYHGPKVHNEKEMLISTIGVLGVGIVYGLVNHNVEGKNVRKLEADYTGFEDYDLSGIPAAADQIPLFARPSALGNAYVAVSDDAYGVMYNPAGMAWVGGPECAIAYQYRFGIDNIAATYVNKATREIGFGQAVFYSADRDHLLTELYFITALAYKVTRLPSFVRPFSIGASVKVVSNRVAGGMEDSPSGSSFGAGIDLGFLWEVSEQIRYGLHFKDVPVINKWKNVSTGESYFEPHAATLNMGGALQVGYMTLLVAEGQIPIYKEQNWKMAGGIEQEIFKVIFVRLGMQKVIMKESGWKMTSGLGITVKNVSVDASYEYNRVRVFDVFNGSVKIGF
jgi:hypothetical protein